MDDDILTIEEVAKYLRVSERTVYDWAQKGEIPSGKIGTVWRFKKSEIERWVNERLSSNRPVSLINSVKIQNIISLDRIIFLDYPSKRDALIKLAENLSTAPQIKNKEELISEIIRREELMSTAIGKGIAIPHVRLNSVTDLVVSIGISRCDIVDFQTLDDVPVRLLFMIAAAFNQHAYYLQTLSFFSARLKVVELRDGLLNCKTTQEAYDLLIQQDR
ncbi:MAG TPA: PTS sugar transporter subunit IIA [Rectinema sp.]|jgi:PTS system nitrogen regulatory IIA component|nr:PTS sugar transporter subunit IIA [Spirochaetia bacterium]MDI9427253.1 PTS sugar transporter subunit IIA [Spirochaetota bacterium]NLH89247.1 PTS transporter subunit EIIA [Treponema sp.]OQC74969.1 MAG: PTS system fructose-specific EIIABC component [Spirochaetes bacterium ADurb.Bin001]HNP93438.1 PTS sugar transporter subunit IIA [Rectinema sp.]